MNPADLVLPTRVVKPWPALDIGLLVAQHWWVPMFATWLIPPAVLLLLLNLLFLHHPYVAAFAIWWLKPFWDRLPLWYLSRAIFAEPPPLGQSLRSILRVYKVDWLPWLLWRRFHFSRSFVMPVTVLELQQAGARARRVQALQNNNSFASYALTFTLVHLEVLLPLAILGLVWMLLPEWQEVDYRGLWSWYQQHLSVAWFFCWLSLLCMAAIAPFYVAGGFMLYLHRRIELEGWDIEIGFRQTAHRWQTLSRTLLFAVVLGTLSISSPAPVMAEVSEVPASLRAPVEDTTPTGEARRRIVDVMQSEHFENKKVIHYWRKKDRAQKPSHSLTEWLAAWVGDHWEGLSPATLAQLARVFEILLWLVLAAAVGLIAYRLRQPLGLARKSAAGQRAQQAEQRLPETLFGLQLEPETLPENIALQAQSLLEQGGIKEAVGLLYRAAISRFIHEQGLPIKKHFTELECQALINRALANTPHADFFARLTSLWLQSVYAHRPPEKGTVDPLCNTWQSLFGASGEARE